MHEPESAGRYRAPTYPNASKKEVAHAAFMSVILSAGHDPNYMQELHDLAMRRETADAACTFQQRLDLAIIAGLEQRSRLNGTKGRVGRDIGSCSAWLRQQGALER
jgi:hypothetical protein